MTEKYLEQKIGWYKLILTLLFAASASSLGWFVNNLDAVFSLKLLTILGFMVFLSGIGYCISRTRQYIKKLGEYK